MREATKRGLFMDDKLKQLEIKAQEILKQAEESGVLNNFLFTTTFNSYLVQLKILAKLEEEINELGMLVTKEYVKGRENLVPNPAITAYNNTANSASRLVSTLLKVVQEFKADKKGKEVDPLLEIINGGGNID
jgi:hypothetical protein